MWNARNTSMRNNKTACGITPHEPSRRAAEPRVTQRKIYTTREEAKGEIFNFIEMFYNPVKRHSHTGGVSPVKFEEDYFSRLEGV